MRRGECGMSHEKFLQQAIDLALENTEKYKMQPFGAVIVKDSKVIATGVNEIASCNDPTAHAEIQAIRKACKKLESPELPGCIMYASSQPCPLCMEAIGWAGMEGVYHAATFDDSRPGGFTPRADWDEPVVHIDMKGEQLKPVKAWMKLHNL